MPYFFMDSPFGMAVPFFVIGAIVAAVRDYRGNESAISIAVSSALAGFAWYSIGVAVIWIGGIAWWALSI